MTTSLPRAGDVTACSACGRVAVHARLLALCSGCGHRVAVAGRAPRPTFAQSLAALVRPGGRVPGW